MTRTLVCLFDGEIINKPCLTSHTTIHIYITLTFETTKQLPVWSGYVLKKKTSIYIGKSPNYRIPIDILVTSPLFVCYPTVIGGWRQGLTTKTTHWIVSPHCQYQDHRANLQLSPWGTPIQFDLIPWNSHELYHNEIRAQWYGNPIHHELYHNGIGLSYLWFWVTL